MRIFEFSKRFPAEERWALIGQIRRSSRSVCLNLCEAWAKRRYEAHFVSKLTDADGEQLETQHWLTEAYDCGYLTAAETKHLGELCLEIGRMLGEMMSKADQFCQTPDAHLHEAPVDYRIQGDPSALTDD